LRVERFLECAGECDEQMDKLLRLQRFLRGEAERLITSDPQLAAHRLQQAAALTHDILQVHDKYDRRAYGTVCVETKLQLRHTKQAS
jgi:hypothetical protein